MRFRLLKYIFHIYTTLRKPVAKRKTAINFNRTFCVLSFVFAGLNFSTLDCSALIFFFGGLAHQMLEQILMKLLLVLFRSIFLPNLKFLSVCVLFAICSCAMKMCSYSSIYFLPHFNSRNVTTPTRIGNGFYFLSTDSFHFMYPYSYCCCYQPD